MQGNLAPQNDQLLTISLGQEIEISERSSMLFILAVMDELPIGNSDLN